MVLRGTEELASALGVFRTGGFNEFFSIQVLTCQHFWEAKVDVQPKTTAKKTTSRIQSWEPKVPPPRPPPPRNKALIRPYWGKPIAQSFQMLIQWSPPKKSFSKSLRMQWRMQWLFVHQGKVVYIPEVIFFCGDFLAAKKMQSFMILYSICYVYMYITSRGCMDWCHFMKDETYLGGGFKYLSFFTPKLGRWSNLTSIFLRWVVQPPTRWYKMFIMKPFSLALTNDLTL